MSVICDTCRGSGWQWRDSLPVFGVMPGDPDRPPPVMRGTYPAGRLGTPCPDCGGYGIVHCCEGDREIEDDDRPEV
jgi:hypothetical protein